MRKILKTLLWIVAVIAVIYVMLVIAPLLFNRAKLRSNGYTKEEVRLFELIKYHQDMVDTALGKGEMKVKEWGHLVEVYDEDDVTLLGYSVDAHPERPYVAKRYYLTKDKTLLWWGNLKDGIDDEGREHLRTGKGF